MLISIMDNIGYRAILIIDGEQINYNGKLS